jgi:hypothetical protein
VDTEGFVLRAVGHPADIMEISWRYHGDIMEISWRYLEISGDIWRYLEISWIAMA